MLLFFLFLYVCICVCVFVQIVLSCPSMATQRAKASLVGDLFIHTANNDAENPHEHQNHGLLSPSTSISRSHEGGEEIIDPLEKPSILRLSSPELGENITTDTQPLLTSHSLSYENGQERKESTKPKLSSLTTAQTSPPTKVHIDVSEASKQQSTDVAQQTSSLPTPIPSTPVEAQKPPIELTFPLKPDTQLLIPQLSSRRKARRMAPRKTPTPPIPLHIHILALADRHAHPYASIAPKYTFTLRIVPDTTIREAGVQAGIYLKGRFTTPVDSDRFEARDENGHVFDGTEIIGQELGAGGALYLIEDAIDVEEVRRTWVRKMDSKETGFRTPKAKKVKEPRKTPSERNKEIAEEGKRAVRTEPRKSSVQPSSVGRARSASRRRTLSLAPLELEDRDVPPNQPILMSPKPQQVDVVPESVIESIEDLPQAANVKEKRQLNEKSAASGRGLEVTGASPAPVQSASRRIGTTRPLKPDDDASKKLAQSIEHNPSVIKTITNSDCPSQPAVASQHKLPQQSSMVVRPPLDSSVVPDSQEQPSQVDTPSRDEKMSTAFTPINARRPLGETKQHSATRPKASTQRPLAAEKEGVKQNQPQFPLGKIDPYDISAVLSEDEYYSPRASKTIMSTSIRKLGSARKRSTPASASIPRNSLLIAQEDPPPAAQQGHPKPPPVRATSAAASRVERPAVPSTPIASAAHTPSVQTGLSSGPGPLLSSPTNHVAAALARGRAKARRQPQPECCVIEDSDVEVLGDVLVDSQLQNTDSPKQLKSLEASLPWSAPPLRLGGEDPFWTLRTTGRRPSVRRRSDVDEVLDAAVNDNKAFDSKEQVTVPVVSSEAIAPLKLSTSNISSFSLGSPVKGPAKKAPQEAALKRPPKSTLNKSQQKSTGKSPLLLVHGSSSSEQGVEEIGYTDDAVARKKPASPVEGEEIEIINISSDQDGLQDEEETHGFVAGRVLADAPFGDEELIECPQAAQEDNGLALPDDNQTCLFDTSELPDDIPTTLEDRPQLPKEPSRLAQNSMTDPESKEKVIEDTASSLQPSKRKRDSSNGFDSEEERRAAKRAKREAKKAEKKRLREEKLAREEQQKREHEARLQEERKRLAMEKAYRRARELELVVSSPSKAAEMGLGLSDAYDSEQESELGSSPPERAAAPPMFKVSDDSLESNESEESQSWRELSKRHFSASPSSSLKEDVAKGFEGSSALSTNRVTTAVEGVSAVLTDHKAQAPHEDGNSTDIERQAQRKCLEDWAFVETMMGASAYSPLQVHDRVHMQMVLASLQGHTSGGAHEVEDSNCSRKRGDNSREGVLVKPQPDTLITHQDGIRRSQSKKNAQAQESAEDDDDEEESVIIEHTIRSPAPSPKDLTAAVRAQRASDDRQQHKKAQTKGQRRKSKDNSRKKKRRQKAKQGSCKDLRRMHAFRVRGKRQ